MKNWIPALLFSAMCFAQTASNAQPGLQWAKSMGGTSNDQGSKITTDALGNTYTTGYFNDTVDFDPGANVYELVSVSSDDIFIQKLDANGDFVWAHAIGSNGNDRGNAIALDSEGNVYIAGHYRNQADFDPSANVHNMTPVGVQDGFVLKLDNDGNFIWAASFGGSQVDGCSGIAVDEDGNAVFCGFISSSTDFDPSPSTSYSPSVFGGTDIFVCKLSGDGNFIRAGIMGGGNFDNPFGIALDKAGNVYTVGRFSGTADFNPGVSTYNKTSAGGEEIFVSKLDSTLGFVWAKTIGSTSNDYGADIALDSLNNVYTTGYFAGTADFDPDVTSHNMISAGGKDAFISVLDSNGVFVAAYQFGGTGDDQGKGIFASPDGNVLCTGTFAGTVDFDPGVNVSSLTSVAASSDAFVVKLDASGNLVYNFAFGDSGNDSGADIIEDNSGAITCTGYYSATPDFDPIGSVFNLTANGLTDVYVCKLDPDISVGIGNQKGMDFSIYPNPFTTQTTVIFNAEQANATYRILDVLGNEVKAATAIQGSKVLIERGQMSRGIYFVEITDGNRNGVSRKVVLQ